MTKEKFQIKKNYQEFIVYRNNSFMTTRNIYMKLLILGITPCGVRGAPTGIFTRVSEYSAWISANTGVLH